ncbi:hypothetical protein BSKO_05121 [Bryopsis sp. KO-2023]|nr:hypothetical protein BSKO_05121 [Bryopsis sp. KO-2023]
MSVVALTPEALKERFEDARRTYKLNIGYAGLEALPDGIIQQVQKYNPHIMELELSSNNLVDLPDELAEFQYIRVLRLKYNQLKKLPSVMVHLQQLMVLELSGNQITKVDEFVAHLPHIKELDLSGNLLKEIPDAICEMPSIQVLQLENNRIEQLPENIGHLKSLIRLDVSTNNLRFLPASMGKLKKIQRIDCANNMLGRIPPSMGHLKTLKELNLRYNALDERYRAKVEEGLSRFLTFLREEEERERLEEIERLKPIGTQVGSYLEYRCKAEIGQVVKSETGQVVVDNRCWIRTGQTTTQVGKVLYAFGGTLVKNGTKTSDLFWISTDRMEWHNQVTKGEAPAARDGHCAIHDEENNRLVVFGGRNNDRKRLNDTHYLDLDTFTWHRPTTEAPPTPREHATAALWAGHMVVFGGHGSGARLNDLYILDLHTWHWSQPATSGTAPSPRQSVALCIGNGNQLFVHGGRNNFVLDDLFYLDLVTKTWFEVPTGGRAPPPRHCHLMAIHNEHAFCFGGYDELGAHTHSMYRLPVPYGENLTTSRPEWEEWESEMQYNKSRSTCLSEGYIYMIQLGSPTLGKVNEDEAEKGLVYWDVFKMAKLDVLKPKVLDEESLKPKNAKRLRIEHTITVASKMPKTFTTINPKEVKMMSHTEKFQHTFRQLYPHRRPLFLTPKNECGTAKFVCTTIRPTQMPYTELYELEGIINFVADFLHYEPLENPLHPPEYLASPMSVLGWQAGDCFDIAATLCSLLIGVGFDAYVVVGYGPRAIVVNDQTMMPFTGFENKKKSGNNGQNQTNNSKSGTEKPPKYQIKPRWVMESKFIKEQTEAALKKKEEEEKTILEQEAEKQKDLLDSMRDDDGEDENKGKHVHAWVMVAMGSRDVSQSLFVEPSTGQTFPLDKSPYEGVEFLWNHLNFWVCMQMPEPHSDSRADPKNISFNLADPSKWEFVLPENLPEAAFTLDVEADAKDGTPGTLRSIKNIPSTARQNPGSQKGTASPLRSTLNTPGGSTSRLPNQGSTPATRQDGERVGSAGSQTGEQPGGVIESSQIDVYVDVPPSWVPKLNIPRDVFDMRCPRGQKTTLYYKSQQEKFAYFGECSRWDGMMERVTMYKDEERMVVTEIREHFCRRKDNLRERKVYPMKETTIEYFDPGSSFGIKELLVIRGEKNVMDFYHTARLDGLIRREEYIGTKMIETFQDRDDRLVYRSVTYGKVEPGQEETQQAKSGRRKKRQEDVLPIRKMTEKFARNPEVDSEEDVAKRVFYLSEDQIRIEFHYGKDRVTNSGRVFHKDGHSHIVQVDPLAPRLQPSFLLEEYQRLLVAENDCMQSVRDSEWEVKEIARVRTNQEQNITLATPYYDIMQSKSEESDEEEEEKAEVQYDHLSPFLPPMIGDQVLNREQALEVREKALKALKERLIERANIIQARHDEETAALTKRQANYQRDRDQMTREEEEEYEQACEESLFRIHILEKRLKRHEEQALQKYFQLDQKLRSDPRLAVLLQPPRE